MKSLFDEITQENIAEITTNIQNGISALKTEIDLDPLLDRIGDARTNMVNRGLINLGQLAREKYKPSEVTLVGFGSYQGSVIAGDEWGAPMKKMPVPPARANSWEAILHPIAPDDKLILLTQQFVDEQPDLPIGHRAIGVVYRPDQQRYGNYVASIIPQRYDAFIFIDKTEALHPIHIQPDGEKVPETYPFNV